MKTYLVCYSQNHGTIKAPRRIVWTALVKLDNRRELPVGFACWRDVIEAHLKATGTKWQRSDKVALKVESYGELDMLLAQKVTTVNM